jgi:hypothetical protein
MIYMQTLKAIAPRTDVSPRERLFAGRHRPLTFVLPDLGRTPDMIPTEFSQNNTHLSISYWKTVEELEAFARRPVHLKGLKFLVSSLLGDKPHQLGVVVSNLECRFLPYLANLEVNSRSMLDQESCSESNTPIKRT